MTADLICAVCDEPIEGDDIDDRHNDNEGHDVHADHCPVCEAN